MAWTKTTKRFTYIIHWLARLSASCMGDGSGSGAILVVLPGRRWLSARWLFLYRAFSPHTSLRSGRCNRAQGASGDLNSSGSAMIRWLMSRSSRQPLASADCAAGDVSSAATLSRWARWYSASPAGQYPGGGADVTPPFGDRRCGSGVT